eukprot:scaffold107269_cov34-Tisochrysis_lutea.AAC.7
MAAHTSSRRSVMKAIEYARDRWSASTRCCQEEMPCVSAARARFTKESGALAALSRSEVWVSWRLGRSGEEGGCTSARDMPR